MSELSFGTIDNSADLMKKVTQIRGAISDLEYGFVTLTTSAMTCIDEMEHFVNTVKAQIDSAIKTLSMINSENQARLWSLQSNSGNQSMSNDSTDGMYASQVGTIQSEISARKDLAIEIDHQTNVLEEQKDKLSEYQQQLKQSNDAQKAFDSGLKGIKSGLEGVSGLFSSVTGVMELFGLENENLRKIMQKVQTAISITNGLQAVSAALNKDSAFQLNVLGKVKLWWRNITLQAAAAQGAETVAASRGIVANLGLAGAFRAIGMAVKSFTVIGRVVSVISTLIGFCSLWSSTTSKQKDKQKELNKEVEDFNKKVQGYAAKPIASIELLSYKFKMLGENMEAQKRFVNENKKSFDELGLSISNVKDAQQLLIDNKDKFIKAQIAKATSLAYMDLVREEAKKFIDAQMSADTWQNKADEKKKKSENGKRIELNGNIDNHLDYAAMSDNIAVHKPEVMEALDPDLVKVEFFNKKAKDSEVKMNYSLKQKISYDELANELMPGKKSDIGDGGKGSKLEELQKRLNGIYEIQAHERQRQAKDLENKNCQAEIDAMNEGSDKKIAQMLFNYDRELEELEREKKNLLKQRTKTAEEAFNFNEDLEMAKDPKRNRQTFDPSKVQLTKGEMDGFGKREADIIKKQNQEIQAYFAAEKKAMNDHLAAYGDYEQKREAIIALSEDKKKGKSKGEQDTIDKETNNTLSGLEKEFYKETAVFDKMFSNMKNKSVEEMREIADTAQKALDFVDKGKWDSTKGQEYGIGEATFNKLHNSPKELSDIKDNIKELNDQVLNCDTAFNKMGAGFNKLFKSGSDPKKLTEALSLIESGLNQAMQAGKFLSGALSSLGDSFGNEGLGKAAEGINVAMDAASSAMSGAQAGAMFGPWGAAAGAAIGLVSSLGSSLAKLHDAKHEKAILKIQNQIEVLEKTYENLGDSLEKAYSADASKLIDQQNTLLKQQKVLIQNQIEEERSKKKADKGRIKDWEKQIGEIDKLIADNKEKQIDAILGSDVKAAIDDFAQAYADAWAAGDERAKSSKDFVKQMIKQMIVESIKAASSSPMEALRKKLAGYFSDGIIDAWEREQIEKSAEAISKELDDKYGWADDYLKGDGDTASQDSTRGGFETMSQETGTELNGRFTALQISNEEIRNSMLLALGNLSALCTTTSDGNILLSEMRNLAVMSNGYLEDIAKYTKPILGFGEKLDKIEQNTAKL